MSDALSELDASHGSWHLNLEMVEGEKAKSWEMVFASR